jgi:ketosteroid isomerase-like protein
MKNRKILLALGVVVTVVSFNKGITLGQVQRTQANIERRTGEVPLSNTHSQEQTVDAQTKDQLRVIIAHLLDTLYVSPEIGKQLASQMQAKFESGAYKEITTPTKLAEVLTRDLRELSKDLHLGIRYAPAPGESATILTPEEWERRRSQMFSMVPRGPSTPQAGAAPAGPQGPQRTGPIDARTANLLLESNYHFREAKYLSGNIGYLKLDGFAPGQAARDTAAKMMALLANSEGVIIDMRRCPGGTQEMVNFLASYFFDKEPRLLLTSYFRPTGETVQNKTIADIPGKRMLDTDLFLLVGANTVSACEAFAYILQQYGRAKVIGERTAGAGNHNALIPIGLGYSFSVSIGSVVHPRTGKGWQGDGVQPDTVVKPDDALEAAHREALQKIIGRTTDQNRKKELLSVLQDVARSSDTPKAVANLSESEKEVRKLEREWLDAYEQHDAAAMDRIVADDFKLTQSGGGTQTKADILAALKAAGNSGGPTAKFSTEDVQSRVEGDTVLLSGRVMQRMEHDGQTRTMELRYIDTYVKRQGRWQVVASQLTRIPQQ